LQRVSEVYKKKKKNLHFFILFPHFLGDRAVEKKERKITSWAFCGDEDLREVTRASQENPELLRADMSSESSALLIRELGS
jgi:hypothetical protein